MSTDGKWEQAVACPVDKRGTEHGHACIFSWSVGVRWQGTKLWFRKLLQLGLAQALYIRLAGLIQPLAYLLLSTTIFWALFYTDSFIFLHLMIKFLCLKISQLCSARTLKHRRLNYLMRFGGGGELWPQADPTGRSRRHTSVPQGLFLGDFICSDINEW